MEIEPNDIPEIPHRAPRAETKVSLRKLLASTAAIVASGIVLIPVLFLAFERGWLETLGGTFLVLLVAVYFFAERQKLKCGPEE
jgi:hypothetical protein